MTSVDLSAIGRSLKNWEGVDIGPLSTPLDLEDGRATKVFHRMTTALGLLVVALLALSAVAPLRVTAIAVGQVTPDGSVLPITHLEGGLVAAIEARAGEVVNPGDILIRLSPISAESELAQLNSKRAYLVSQKLRYDALLAGAEPDYAGFSTEYAQFAVEGRKTYEQSRAAFERSVEGLQSRLAQRVASRDAVEKQLGAARRSRALVAEQARLSKQLLSEGFASRQDFLQIENASINAEIEVTRLAGELEAAKEAANETQHAYDQLVAEQRADWQSKSADFEAQILEINALTLRSEDRVERLEIRSPRRALVQDIKPKSAGEVIRPGDAVAVLLPLGDSIVAEIRMRPEDAGHVKVGQKARVQVTSFDPGLYGQIDGDVIYISPTTFTDEKGGTYYKAKISLGDHQLRRGRKRYEILPGMMVQATIVTDERSVLSYLMKPVNRAFQNAMTER